MGSLLAGNSHGVPVFGSCRFFVQGNTPRNELALLSLLPPAACLRSLTRLIGVLQSVVANSHEQVAKTISSSLCTHQPHISADTQHSYKLQLKHSAQCDNNMFALKIHPKFHYAVSEMAHNTFLGELSTSCSYTVPFGMISSCANMHHRMLQGPPTACSKIPDITHRS